MATIGTPTSDATDLLQKLSLDSQPKALEVNDASKFGSITSANGFSSMAKPYERSTTPMQDFTNINMFYSHNGYPYYYGPYEDPLNVWNDYRYLNHDGVDMHSGMQQQRMTSGMGQATGFAGRSHVNDQMYGHFGNAYRGGSGFGLNYYNPKSNWQAWRATDNKFTPKGRNNGFFNYGFENKDTLNELSKGPRAKDVKHQLDFVSAVKLAKGQDLTLKTYIKEENVSATQDEEQYNKEDFPESYADAKFFIIKSYSEDDVHKSVKYNVWASTPNGNKKLDAAYQEAQAKPGRCPVFLLFSVNASGQFVGLAEMVGLVDFNKSMDFWQQDKWTGCFPVKWHIVKDVPNILLKHITLENNDNKPVTNSRDTQEVKLEQGLQVLKIFKSHLSKTSILDDFEFYESRQRALQEKKARRQQYQKQGKSEKGSESDKLSKDVAGAMIEDSPIAPVAVPVRNVQAKVNHDAALSVAADGAKGAKSGKNGSTDGVLSAC